jgi:hypothetical protein
LENVCNTPHGDEVTIDVYLPEFNALATPGGTLTINRGYKGIFVRRITYSEFVAFECACPSCHEERLVPLAGWESAVLICPVDSSMYETVNGQPLEGAASGCPLYSYDTYFDGTVLEIY